jgi:aldose 1-epimerase
MAARHLLPDGRTAGVFDLVAGAVRVRLTDLGATLMRVDAPDRAGRSGNILLGHDSPADYPAGGAPGGHAYAGALCGRFANRIAGAGFDLDGRHVTLMANDGRHTLHGGPTGFDRAIWQVADLTGDAITFTHHSPDGDQGFPGNLDITARYALSPDGTLALTLTARADAPTHLNLVAHPYFDLSAGADATIAAHCLRLAANAFLPTDAEAIPTGERRAVAGTPFDFRVAHPIGDPDATDAQIAIACGYNHNFILDGTGMRDVAWLSHPASGRTLTIATDRPGLQLYTGGYLGAPWHPHAGLCLEAQDWPDAPNWPDFPSTRLDPGVEWRSETRWTIRIS